MNLCMIRKWNERIKKEDKIIHCGDFCFRRSAEAPNAEKNPYEYYKNQLNGQIILINSNHGSNNGSKSIIEHLTIKHGGYKIFCVHDPKYFNPNLEYCFSGHVHNRFGKVYKRNNTIIVDVGVDAWNFYPINIHQINKAIIKFKKT